MKGIIAYIFLILLGIYISTIILLKIPFFQVKEVYLEGLRKDESKYVSEKISSLGRKILFLREDELLDMINKKFSNRFRKVEIDRVFTSGGVIVNIKVLRREPIAVVILRNRKFLMDKEGNLFKDKNLKVKRKIYVSSDKLFKANKSKIIKLTNYADVIRMNNNLTELKIKNRIFVMKPASLIRDEDLKKLKYAYKNFKNYKKIDIRYKSFILLK